MLGNFNPENLLDWALQLLKEKEHVVGETRTWDDVPRAVSKTDIDGTPRTPGEIIQLAARYPEWPDRQREHLEYLRNRQG